MYMFYQDTVELFYYHYHNYQSLILIMFSQLHEFCFTILISCVPSANKILESFLQNNTNILLVFIPHLIENEDGQGSYTFPSS